MKLPARFLTSLILILAPLQSAPPAYAQQDLFNTFLGIGVNVLLNEAGKREGQRNPAPGGGSPRSTPAADPQVLALQHRLDALGYDVGTPDGVVGSKTRRAISAYQASIGAAQTGELTTAQLGQLLGSGAAPIGAGGLVASTGSMTVLHDTDLPNNDYRSGMQDPALKGIDLSACEVMCVADGQCRAFTYNANAKVCFLKSATGSPTPFRGAISGTKDGSAIASVVPLSRSEIAELQAALNARGYDVGEPDGIVGSRTRTALADFLSGRGLSPTLSMRDALGELTGTADVALGQSGFSALTALATGQPAADAGGAASPVLALPDGAIDRVELEYAARYPDLLRMLVEARPQVLDDKDFLERLFGDEGRRFTSTYRIDDELAAFKAEYLARPVPDTIYLELTSDVSLTRSEYRRDIGLFPFYSSWEKEQAEKFLNFTAWLDENYSVSFAAPRLPQVVGLPMTLDEAEAFEREWFDRNSDYFFVELRQKVAISEVSFDTNRSAFLGKVDVFSVEAYERYEEEAPMLYAWAIPEVAPDAAAGEPATVAATDLAGLAGVLPDIALIDGHLDLRAAAGWPHVAASLFFAGSPSALDDLQLAAALGKGLLTAEEQKTLWRGEIPYEWEDFSRMTGAEMVQIREILALEFGDALRSRIIGTDFKTVDVVPVSFSNFDAESGVIALDYSYPDPAVGDGRWGSSLSWSMGMTLLPDALPLDQTMAQRLIDLFGGDPMGQPAYIAIFGDVVSTRSPDERRRGEVFKVELVTKPNRIAIFRDRELTELIFDYYADPKEWLLAQQRNFEELRTLVDIPAVNMDALHRLVIGMSGDATYLDDLVQHMAQDRAFNEFQLLEETERVADAILEVEPDPTIWLTGKLDLGKYDIATESFEVSGSSFRISYEHSAAGLVDNDFTFAFINQPQSLKVPLAQARAFIERSGDERQVEARLRVLPVQTSVNRTRYGDIEPHFTFHLERLVLFTRNGSATSGVEKLVDLDNGAYSGLTTADAPQPGEALSDLPVFDQELAALMVMGSGDVTLTPVEFKRMLASRWLAEQDLGFRPSVGARFFAEGTQLPDPASADLYRENFETWMAGLAGETPPRLRLNIDFSDNRQRDIVAAQCGYMEWGLRYVFQNEQIAQAVIGESGGTLQDQQMRRIGAGSDENPAMVENFLVGFPQASLVDCGVAASKSVASAWDLNSEVPVQKVFVLLDRMPVPNFLGSTRYNAASAEVIVTGTELLPSESGLPILVVRAELVKADLLTTGVEAGQVTVTASKTFEPASSDVPTVGYDVLGIRIGMSEADADAAIKTHLKSPLVLKTNFDLSPATPSFSDVVMYISDDRKERIALFYEAGSGERVVLGVDRIIYAPDWGLPRTDVNASAIAKYGQAGHTDVNEFSTIMAWGPGSANSDCLQAGDGSVLADQWQDENGATGRLTDFLEWNQARDSGIAYLPQPNWDLGLQACGGLMLLRHDQYRLETLLIDPAQYYSTWQKSLGLAEQRVKDLVQEGGSGAIVF